VKLWGLRVLNAQGSGTTADVIRAVDWVIAKKNEIGGRWVINMSLGSNNASPAEQEAMSRAIAAGILPVAATGNDSTADAPQPVSFPAGYPGMFAIGATDEKNAIGSFSNQGPEVSVVAPGVDVLSTLPVGSGLLATAVAGSSAYVGAPLTGSKEGTVSGPFVFCNLGKVGEFPASVNGKIAVIQRGDIRFSEKTKNAKEAGATAVVIFNRDDSALSFTLINDDEPWGATYAWPVTIALSKADGEALVAKPNASITVKLEKDDYGRLSGTSMATPHASAVAALVWSAAPNATADMVKDAMIATAKDLGAVGRDNVFGAGLVDALNAAKKLAPSAFGNPSTPANGVPSGRRILIRGR
jgi:subtilisin family serine protease